MASLIGAASSNAAAEEVAQDAAEATTAMVMVGVDEAVHRGVAIAGVVAAAGTVATTNSSSAQNEVNCKKSLSYIIITIKKGVQQEDSMYKVYFASLFHSAL